MTVLTDLDHQDTRPTAVLHLEVQYGLSHISVFSFCFALFVLFFIMVIVVVFPLLPSLFIAAPSYTATRGGNVQTIYDLVGRYVPSPYLL